MLTLRFDPHQEHQVAAVQAVVDLFEGQPYRVGALSIAELDVGAAAVPNAVDLDSAMLLENLQGVQARNGISVDPELRLLRGTEDSGVGETPIAFPNFALEMETGTGKTYAYIRTALELARQFGIRKFIVVVPSLAVREGVKATFDRTKGHMAGLFRNLPYDYYVYDSGNPSMVRQFALSDSVQFMIMTLDSFNKSANLVSQPTNRLQDLAPLDLIRAVRPVLILDEPQNMESDKSRAALARLNPSAALRYSATHRNPYNVVYRLTPYDAYRLGLVKRIEVYSVVRDGDDARPYIRVDKIVSERRQATATVTVRVLGRAGSAKLTSIRIKCGDELEDKTGLPEYAAFRVDEINPGYGTVVFGNSVEVAVNEAIGADREAIFRAQIWATIEAHFLKQRRLRELGIKVLSLFFIDRVENYADDGIIRRLFDEAYAELALRYPEWSGVSASGVQAAYFAKRRRSTGVVELLDSATGEAQADREAYDLIMSDKESLLSFPGPDDDSESLQKKQVCFIFSHSALREGWDNPNVFQICTLNESASSMRKRQEIGRGIRLAVNQLGNRVSDETSNILTVVANQSYEGYVASLQSEIASDYQSEIEARWGKRLDELSADDRAAIEAEYGEGILPPAPRRSGGSTASLDRRVALSPDFLALWERIGKKTRYRVSIDSARLVDDVAHTLLLEPIERPRISLVKSRVEVGPAGFEAMQISAARSLGSLVGRFPLPNVLDLVSRMLEASNPPVRITRRTLMDVLLSVGPSATSLLESPFEFAAAAARVLREKLADQLVDGIRYEQTGAWYDMAQILDHDEVELFTAAVAASAGKSLYDLVPYDSGVEASFVSALEAREDVLVYCKLPTWFEVMTPVGAYRPDWAIVVGTPEGSDLRLYLVAETKGTTRRAKLRPDEARKIKAGEAHFAALENVRYKVVASAAEIP